MRYKLIPSSTLPLLLLCGQPLWAQGACTDPGADWNIDYRDPKDAGTLLNVNTNHFDENVENLIKGKSGSIASDLDYTLRHVPNHHRALYAMVRQHLLEGTERFQDETNSATCWLERAARFAPNDAVIPMIYGIYLHRKKDFDEAERRYRTALELSPNFAEAHYNLALLYFDMRRFEDSREQAHEAYGLGFPLPGLRQKLIDAGYWDAAGSEQ